MSRISDVSSKLGEYMLKSYILTDAACPTCSIPMLRSPAGVSPQRLFCAQCPDQPPQPHAPENEPTPTGSSASTEELSRVSTAPTEISSSLSSPTFAPAPVTQETLQRRAQSDMASAEIGRRMLRGWAMLAEICPNESCYSIPLVRPPLPGGNIHPNKECVVCGGIYVYENNALGQRVLVPATPHSPISVPVQTASHIDDNVPVQAASHIDDKPDIVATGESTTTRLHDEIRVLNEKTTEQKELSTQPFTETLSTLSLTISSLEQALHTLTRRMSVLGGQVPPDHVQMGEVAVSIEQVTNAVRTAKFLHFQESRP